MGQMNMDQNDSQAERRVFSRIPFSGKVTVVRDQAQWVADLMDISMKGVLVSRPDDWSAATDGEFHLMLSLDDRNRFTIAMDASLVHASTDSLGFRCDHIDLESMTHLRRLLELNLGDEERINRELSALIHVPGAPAD